MKCPVCGKDADQMVKFDHGEFPMPCSYICRMILNLRVNGSFPILWAGKEEFDEFDENDNEDLKKYLDNITEEQEMALAEDIRDYALNDSFWSDWQEALKHGHRMLERDIIKRATKEQLPLLLDVVHEDNREILNEKLKEI